MPQLTPQTTSTTAPQATTSQGSSSAALTGQARGMSFEQGEALLDPSRPRYTVRPGDTLGVIAKRTLGDAGRWKELHALNEALIGPNPDRIQAGQVLVLPAGATVEASGPEQAGPTAQQTGPGAGTQRNVPPVREQVGGLAQIVATQSRQAATTQGAPGEAGALGERGKERFQAPTQNGPRDKVLFQHTDPMLGQFQAVLNLNGDLSTRATQRHLTISSEGGLIIRTPGGMSDLVIHRIVLDLQTMAIRIDSTPEIGPLEYKIISGILRETLLAQAPELAQQKEGPLAAAMAKLPSDPKGKKIVYDYRALGVSLLSVLVDPATAATVTFNGKGLKIDMFPGLLVDTVGPDFHIAALRYNFATATFDVEQQGATTVLGVIGDSLKQPLIDGVEMAGQRFFKDKLPAAMRAPGYDPTVDPKFQDNLDALYANFTGVHLLGGQPGTKKDGAGTTPAATTGAGAQSTGGVTTGAGRTTAATTTTAAPPKQDGAPPPARQVLYALQTKDFGAVEVCLEPGDSVKLYKDEASVGLDAGKGLFLRVPGHAWLQDVRLTAIRYNLKTGQLDFSGTDKMGEFVRSVLEDVVNAYVIPKLPGVARRGVGLEGQTDGKHQILYSGDIPGAGRVDLMLDKTDRLTLAKTEQTVDLSAPRGLILRAPSLPALAQLRIQRIHYVLGTDELRIDSDNDVGPAGELIIARMLRKFVVPQLPGAIKPQSASAPTVDKQKLKAYPNVVHTQKVGALGTVDVRLAGGDTLGVRSDGETATVYAKAGVLLVVPDAGIALVLNSVSLNTKTGAVDVAASETFGAFEKSALSDVARKFALPIIEKHYKQPAQTQGADHRVLYHFAGGGLDLDVCLDKGDAVTVEKSDRALTLSAQKGILLRSKPGGLLPESVRLDRVRVDLQSGAVVVDSRPDVGDLGELIATQAMRELVMPHLPAELQKVGLGAPTAEVPGAQALPRPDGLSLYEGQVPGVGAFDVSVNGASAMKVDASVSSVDITSSSGLLVRVPGLKLAVRINAVSLDLKGGAVQVSTSAPLGAFEQGLVQNIFKLYGQPMVSRFITTPQKEGAAAAAGDFDVLYSYQTTHVGRVSVCVPKGAGVSVQKSDTHLSVVAPKGVFFTGPDFLPEFKLQRIDYELGTGKFGIDVSGVAQGHYVEGQDVGPLTERVVANLVKALVGPHLPAQAQALGVVGFKPGEGEAQGPPPEANKLFEKKAGSLGDVAIYLDKGDSLSISASETEGSVRSAKGLIVDMPAIRTRERMHGVRYHFKTGEIQVDGLGAFENAFLQAAITEFVTPLLPKQFQGGATPVDAALSALPKDRKGAHELMDSTFIGVTMAAGTTFDVGLAGDGLRLKAKPGLHIDGPLFANFELDGVRFLFAERGFKLDLEGSNIGARAIDGTARRKAEKSLDEMFLPLMPEVMLKPGYDLMKDGQLTEHLAQVAQNFAARKPSK